MLDDIRKVWALFPAVWADARASVARYWWLVLAAAICACAATTLEIHASNYGGTPDDYTLVFIFVVIGFALPVWYWFGVYGRAIRIEEPSFRMTLAAALPIISYNIGIVLAILVACIPAMIAQYGFNQIPIAVVLYAVAAIFIGVRFVFVVYAIEFEDRPFAFSWDLTRGTAFVGVATVFLTAAAAVVGIDLLANFAASALLPAAMIPIVAVITLIKYVVAAIVAPWTMRMMMLYAGSLEKINWSGEATARASDEISS